MANVITYGTFDLFHIGHLRLLERAKALAGEDGKLVVAVSTDDFNWNSKRKKSVVRDRDRMAIVAALKCVDAVIPETCWEQKRDDVAKNDIDIFVMGDDWRGKFDFLSDVCKVVYLPRTDGVSSTDLKLSATPDDLSYGTYRAPASIRLKNATARFLKKHGLGNALIYPALSKLWHSYADVRRRRRLQKEGPSAIKRLHSLMLRNGVQYYCDYGTLLGFVRDGGFIPHDDDIDISIQPDSIRQSALLKIFLDSGYGFVHAFDYNGRLMEFTVADASGITIDVFFPTQDESPDRQGGVQGYQPVWDPARKYPDDKANHVVQYDFAKAVGVRTVSVAGVAAMIPGNAEEVLESEYGPWRIPDAKFNTVTDRVHRELDGFAFRITREEALSHD